MLQNSFESSEHMDLNIQIVLLKFSVMICHLYTFFINFFIDPAEQHTHVNIIAAMRIIVTFSCHCRW